METPAETGARLGIPSDRLEDLIEHPKIARALVIARDNPNLAPEAIFAKEDLPVCDPDGLDLDKVQLELDTLRRAGERSDGSHRTVERMEGSAMAIGRYQRAERLVADFKAEAHEVLVLLGADGTMPAVTSLNAARRRLEGMLK